MYGFRVFEVRACKGPTGLIALDVSDPLGDGRPLLQRVERAVASLSGRSLLTGIPNLQHPSSWTPALAPRQGDPQTLFVGTQQIEPLQVLLRLEYGFRGEFDHAYGEHDVVNMRDRSASVIYRALLLLPAAGTRSLLVVETRDRTCPATSLVSWLGRAEYEADHSAWVRLRIAQVADPQKLATMARNAESVSAILTQRRPGMPGGDAGETVKLIHKTKEQRRKEGLIAEALSWLGDHRELGLVERVESIAGYDPEQLDQANLRFDHASIEVVEDGKPKVINPDTIRARFTYPASRDLQLDDESWIDRVRAELSGPLSEGTDIQV